MFWRKTKRQQRGRPLSAARINQLADNAEWIGKLSVAPPLGMQYNPTGTHIYLQRPEPVMARLSGSTSPYSFVEVYSSAPGTWTTLPGGRTGTTNAYELMAKSGCTEVVELTAMGGWMAFQWLGYSLIWTFNVFGCNSVALAGALVELRQSGVLINSCTTANGTGGTTLGRCVMTVPAGTYDITITGPTGAGYAVYTATTTVSTTVSTSTTLVPDSTHICIAVCNFPVPKTLFTTDGLGTHTLTWNGVSAWVGTGTTTVGIRSVIDSITQACTVGGTMTVTYTVDQTLKIKVAWKLSCCITRNGGGFPTQVDYVWGDDASGGGSSSNKPIEATGTVTISSCNPVSATTNVATVGTVLFATQNFCGTVGASDTFAGFNTPGGGGLMAVTA